MIQHFSALPENTWFECMTEDIQINSILSNLFERVGTKVSTFGELQTFYFKGKRRHPYIPELENVTIRELNLDKKVVSPLIQSIEKKLNDLPSFANHHSNYNRKKSWSVGRILTSFSATVIRVFSDKKLNRFGRLLGSLYQSPPPL